MVTKKKSSRKVKQVKPGIYNAMVEKVTDEGNGSVTVQFGLFGKGFKVTERFTTKPEKQTVPDEGATKYLVGCHKLGIYTAIGADNVHHAANKATKLFGPHWSLLRNTFQSGAFENYEFYTVANFSAAIKALKN